LAVISSVQPAVGQDATGALLSRYVTKQADRSPAHADLGPLTRLSGHLPPWATARNRTSDSIDPLATRHLRLILSRAPEVQTAFEKLLHDQQDPASPVYHRWLTPQQVGTLFGPTQADVRAVSDWAEAQGLHVESVTASRMVVELSGSTATVASAFRVSFGSFSVRGAAHVAILNEPCIPAALSPLIQAVSGLSDEIVLPSIHAPELTFAAKQDDVRPLYTGSGYNALYPADIAAIYDIATVYAGGNFGAKIGSKPQHVAVYGLSPILASDISDYARVSAIGTVTFNTITLRPGSPVPAGWATENTLDVERVLGTAPGAVADLIVGSIFDYPFDAVEYNTDTLLDPVMSISLSTCGELPAGDASFDALFSAAAAEGISVVVASGDGGADGCAMPGSAPPASTPLRSINGVCASSYVTCVGGTEFNDTANPAAYWSSTNAANGKSALGYIPEGAWNDPQYVSTNGTTVYQMASGTGGASQYIAKPYWQTGTGVPADGARDVPDVSLAASFDHDGYLLCDGGGSLQDACTGHYTGTLEGGTSASAPTVAGIIALLNTATGTSQGNLNPLLYRLAATHPEAFHDITVATSGVTNCSVLVPSLCNNSVPSPSALTGGLAGYVVTPGYDQATGLGSLDVANLLAAATGVPNPPGFTLATSSAALDFTAGAISGNTETLTLTSVNGFAGTVALACSGPAPAGNLPPTCSINVQSLTLTSGGTATAIISIGSTAAQAHRREALPSVYAAGAGMLALLLSLLFFATHRRRPPALAGILLLALALTGASGCSSGGSTGTHVGTPGTSGQFTFTITGTSASLSANTTFSVIIQ
jgi:subtilase family serine protease